MKIFNHEGTEHEGIKRNKAKTHGRGMLGNGIRTATLIRSFKSFVSFVSFVVKMFGVRCGEATSLTRTIPAAGNLENVPIHG